MDKPSVLIQQRSFPNQNATDEEKATIEYGLKVAKAIEGEWFKKIQIVVGSTINGAIIIHLDYTLGVSSQFKNIKTSYL